MGLFRTTPKNKLVLVANIGTSSPEGMLLISRPEDPPEIIETLRIETPLMPVKDFNTLWRQTRKAFGELLAGLKKKSRQKIDLVAVIFSSPWCVSQTRVARLKKDSSFKITQKLVDNISNDELKNFQNEIKSSFLSSDEEAMIIEKGIMKTLLNGYEVRNFLNKEAKELEVYMYKSAIMKSLYNKFSSLINHEVGNIAFTFNTAPFATFGALGRFLNTDEGFLFINVGGEITEVSFVKDNVVRQTSSFFSGGRSITRKLAGILRLPLQETASLIEQHGFEKLTSSMHDKISKSLFFAAKDWYDFVVKTLDGFGGDSMLPQNIFLTGELSNLKEISQFLNSGELARFTFLGKPFSVQKILPSGFEGRFYSKQGIKNYNYMPLIISSFFIDHHVWQKK